MTSQLWQPVAQPGSLSERIVAQVEKILLEERLAPGQRLPPEREMAQLLGVSRPSLREAVRILEARGRLVVRHGQGVFVAQPGSEQELRAALERAEISINELFAMREVLEVPAAGWAAERMSPEQAAGLRETLASLDTAFDEEHPDFARLAGLDAQFHLGIAGAAGNRFLQQTSNVLNDILLSGMETTLLISGRREKSRREHHRILNALTAGDAAGARRAARAHIRSAHRAALTRMAREQEALPAS
ncbi:FadR family transcriptional regulator [Streptomyces armeniacus]|uniref:FadR family transcriptional regulator n=1 Tax=Streptomyces armeniacus TaxID=83291 RepID=A0A345XIZ6_9ACTN|nr:FCD domain-containing protein [Streptomyces armeniacus]AXK31612.1 FadR family transcriptional regulator [Streptomyces armeniacus]